MVFEWFVSVGMSIVHFFADLLPEFELTGDAAGALSFAMTLNGVLPISELLAVASLGLILITVLFILQVVRALLSHVPGIGGGGA